MLFRLPFKGAIPHSEFLDIAPFGYLLWNILSDSSEIAFKKFDHKKRKLFLKQFPFLFS